MTKYSKKLISFALCIPVILQTFFLSGCSHQSTLPSVTTTESPMMTPTSAYTEMPKVTEENAASKIPERLSKYFNYNAIVADEKKYTKVPKDFQNENDFYDYVFEYSKNQINDILKYISASDFLTINVDTLLEEPFAQTFIVNDKSTVDNLKEIISHLEFQRCSTYKYAESWPDEISPPAGGGGGSFRDLGLYSDGECIYIYYEVDYWTGNAISPNTDSNKDTILRKGFMLFENGEAIYNFGTGKCYSTMRAKMSEADKEKFCILSSQIIKSIKQNYNGVSTDDVILHIDKE